MGFQFEGVCCELNDAKISAANYDDLIKGIVDPKFLGNVLKADVTPIIKEITVPDRMNGNGSNACSIKRIEKIELSLTIQCQKTFNKQLFLGAGRTNHAASTVGAPKVSYKYISKAGAQPGETKLVHFDFPLDPTATGADAFKVEGYNVPATPLILNVATATTTPAAPTLTALVSGVDFTPVYSADGKSIIAIDLSFASTKFGAFTTFVPNAVNLKITGKTFETTQLTPYSQSKVEIFMNWSGMNVAESKNYTFGGAFYKVSCDLASMSIIGDADNVQTMEIKGTALNAPEFRTVRGDLIGSNGTNISNLGHSWNQTN